MDVMFRWEFLVATMQARGNTRCLNVSRNALFYSLFLGILLLSACIAPAATDFEPPPHKGLPSTPTSARSRVVIVEDGNTTVAFKPQPEPVRNLLHYGIMKFSGMTNKAAAWRSLISTQDVIGIKVFSAPGSQVGTRPAVVAGIIEGLLAARVPTNQIIVWDRRLSELQRAGFTDLANEYGVRISGALDSGWDEAAYYESALLGQLVYGDLEFGKEGPGIGRKSFVTKLLTKEVTKIINVSPLLNNNSVGVCGNLYSLAMASVDNTIRFQGDARKLAQAVPEIYALPQLGDRVVLNVVDALICQYEGEQISRLHNSTEVNQIRFSLDPVALDILSVQEIRTRRKNADGNPGSQTNRIDLLENAALMELGTTDLKRMEVETYRKASRSFP